MPRIMVNICMLSQNRNYEIKLPKEGSFENELAKGMSMLGTEFITYLKNF